MSLVLLSGRIVVIKLYCLQIVLIHYTIFCAARKDPEVEFFFYKSTTFVEYR